MAETFCKRDGFPMVNIHGRSECVAEYLQRCLERHTIVDVAQEAQTIYFVFEDGRAIPLLCFCCDTPLAVYDLENERRDMRGRQLESMKCPSGTMEDGREVIQFNLNFAKKGLFGKGVSVPISYLAAIRCPSASPRHLSTTQR